MKGGRAISAVLNDKTVLMVVAIIAILNVIGYLMYRMTHLVLLFGIIGGLTYLFADKNMTLTLGVPLIAVNILVLLHEKYGIMAGLEGMEGMDASGNVARPQVAKKAAVAAAVASKRTPGKHDIHVPETTADTSESSTGDEVEPHTEEAFEGNTKGGRYRVDYASTIEDAYKELHSVLGSESIKNLTADSHNLMKRQLELTESMKLMVPLVQSMSPLLKQMSGLMGSTGLSLPGVAVGAK